MQTKAKPAAAHCQCNGCNGSGKFYCAGAVVNGVYTGKVGVCYRCGGKGYQTPADLRRNGNYDRFYRRAY